MAFLNGVFGNKPQQTQQSQQPNGQQGVVSNSGGQNIPQQIVNGNGSAGPAGNMQQPANTQFQPGNQGGQPNGGNGGQSGQQTINPLDAYFQLMTPSKDVQEFQQRQQQQQTAPLFGNLNDETIQKQVAQTNFTAGLNPETVQKALGGDQQAFMETLNQVAQNAFSSSLQMTKGMVEHGVNTGSERFSSTLDSRFRDLQLRNKNSENPALQHPVGQALLGTIKKQIATANPRMNADQVHAKAEEMFSEFGKMLNPAQPANQNDSQQAQQMNWLAFLDGESS